jgi:hypothetical protein
MSLKLAVVVKGILHDLHEIGDGTGTERDGKNCHETDAEAVVPLQPAVFGDHPACATYIFQVLEVGAVHTASVTGDRNTEWRASSVELFLLVIS